MNALIFAAVYLGILWLAIQPFWSILYGQMRYTGGRFQFSTLDFLAAVFGLTPTAWLAAASVTNPAYRLWEMDDPLSLAATTFLFWFVSQLAGIVMIAATNESPSRKERDHSNSAMFVFAGALTGLLMPLVAPFLAAIHLREIFKDEKPRPPRRHRRAA